MTLTIRLFGREVLSIGVERPEAGGERPNDRGDCTSSPVGFTAVMERPDFVDIPDRY